MFPLLFSDRAASLGDPNGLYAVTVIPCTANVKGCVTMTCRYPGPPVRQKHCLCSGGNQD